MIIGSGITFGSGITIIGDSIVINTSPVLYSSGSMSFNAYGQVTGQQLSISAANTWAFNEKDFTIEYWLYQSYRGPFDSPFGYTSGAPYVSRLFYWPIGTSQNFPYISGTGGIGLSGTTLPSTNSWNHYALVRNSNTATFFLNGLNVASSSITANVTPPTSAFIIGNQGASAITLTGQMTDFRVVNGTAVYTANFAPPITPLIATSNTVLLLNPTSSANLTYDTSSYNRTIINTNVAWSANTPYGTLVQGGLFYNLDMANYVSGNTWNDSSGYNRHFTFYGGNQIVTPGINSSNVVNAGTSTAYFKSSNWNWARAPSAFMNASKSYTKGAVIRGTSGNAAAPFGPGYLQCSAEARDTTWFNNGTQLFCAGNHTTSAYTDVAQSIGSEVLNTWYYVSVTFDPINGWTLYVNGSLVGTSATTAIGPSATTPVIGATQTIPGFNGDIAAAHAYNRPLTAAEHLQNATYWLTRYNGSTPA